MKKLEKNNWWIAAAAAVLAAAFAWAYWPTLAGLVHAWNNVPDYSHGFFVVPVAVFIAWARREQFPGVSGRLAWFGLGLGRAKRRRANAWRSRFYLDAMDGWSILLWVRRSGMVSVAAGRSFAGVCLRWFSCGSWCRCRFAWSTP